MNNVLFSTLQNKKMYKVSVRLLALLPNNEVGSTPQGNQTVYIDCPLPRLQEKLELFYSVTKRYPEILQVLAIDGVIVK